MTFVDDFSVDDVVKALRTMRMTPKARTLVHAIASAPNRAMSRLELARTIGSQSVNACNTVYGRFAQTLALALDASLANQWKPAGGGGGDWVMFINWGPGRWTPPSSGEGDSWVFVMRENLAKALEAVGFAPFQELDAEALAAVAERSGNSDHRDETAEFASDPLTEIELVREELAALSETQREAVIMARVGQGVFRDRLIDAWEGCCSVTGTSVLPALVASHIKPWLHSSNEERLDPNNGLLLVGTLDRLFDQGLITFEEDGRIHIGESIPESEYGALGLSRSLTLRHVPPAAQPFLEFHRQNCFQLPVVY